VFAAAAETGTVLEVDGAYERLDIDAELVKRAINMGIKISIDSDAHRTVDLPNIEYGVLTARRGWASKQDVVNCQPWEQIKPQ
jgi:DNA polymerase (family 10)